MTDRPRALAFDAKADARVAYSEAPVTVGTRCAESFLRRLPRIDQPLLLALAASRG
jgi:hypothetical protein